MDLNEIYRPKRFSDVIGQGANGEILRQQIASGKIAHTYCFEGNRGSGKTTSARIFAKAINCLHPHNGEPCGECENCKKIEKKISVDVTEIDAASNNGVDNIRNIINEMQYAPTECKYKVFIIDEAHMLSIAASNAFLKTLEEPPEYAVIILCTTDPKKLPITVLSRCQRFNFARIQVKDIVSRLQYINKQENGRLENRSLNLIAKLADGAMRDALSLMQQVLSSPDRDYDLVVKILGATTNSLCFSIVDAINQKNSNLAITQFYKVLEAGKDINKFINDLISIFRYIMLVKAGASLELVPMCESDTEFIKNYATTMHIDSVLNILNILIKTQGEMAATSQSAVLIEMAIIKIINLNNSSTESNVTKTDNSQNKADDSKINSVMNAMIDYCAKNGRKDVADILANSAHVLSSDEKSMMIYCDDDKNTNILRKFEEETRFIKYGYKKKLNMNLIINIE